MGTELYYFGYGSLVNRCTRDADEPFIRATLHGWIRQWAHQARRPWNQTTQAGKGVCALTVAEHASSSIDGVLVPIHRDQLPQLDQREAGYSRVVLPLASLTLHQDTQPAADLPGSDAHIVMYVSGTEQNDWANSDYPLIISYVHCVMRGYADQFGEEGMQRLMASTEGWTLPLVDDRQQPLYPRAVSQTAEQEGELDTCLVAHRAQISAPRREG